MENARRDGFRPGVLTGAEDEDEALEVVAAEEHRLSARALTAITGIRLRIDDIIGELSVWARAWAGVFLCLGPIEMGTSQITSHVDFPMCR